MSSFISIIASQVNVDNGTHSTCTFPWWVFEMWILSIALWRSIQEQFDALKKYGY